MENHFKLGDAAAVSPSEPTSSRTTQEIMLPQASSATLAQEGHSVTATDISHILRNRSVSINVVGPGWIIGTALAFIRFLQRLTRSDVTVRFLEEQTPQ